MSTIQMLLSPSHRFDWQPHKKSMNLQRLATRYAPSADEAAFM